MTALQTTTIGSFPKPDYVSVRDWFQDRYTPTYDANYFLSREVETKLALATKEAIAAQVNAGIDVPTDGEIRREHYIFYHLRHLSGIDFDRRQVRQIRTGAWEEQVPTIGNRIVPKDRFLVYDFQIAQSYSSKPVKITIPGPMTIADTIVDEYYGDERALNRDLAEAINVEVRALADAGCRWIQIDEPVFARKPEEALAYGIQDLERCFYGVPDGIRRIVHLCCGYPRHLDEPEEDVRKADPHAYFALAPALEEASIDMVSVEDAHRPVDLSLLEIFSTTNVILGVVAIAKKRVESVQEIGARLTDALNHIDPLRLLAAPDCGLGMLDWPMAQQKLQNLVSAAANVGR